MMDPCKAWNGKAVPPFTRLLGRHRYCMASPTFPQPSAAGILITKYRCKCVNAELEDRAPLLCLFHAAPNESGFDNHAGLMLLSCNKSKGALCKFEASMLVLVDQVR